MTRAWQLAVGLIFLIGVSPLARAQEADVDLVIACIFDGSCTTQDVNMDDRVSAADVVAAVLSRAPTPTLTETPTPTETPTLPPPLTPTDTPTAIPTETATPIPSDTPTPTFSASPTVTDTPTETPVPTPPQGDAIASGSALLVNGMSVIPSVINAIVSGFEFGSSESSAIVSPVITDPSTGGGAGGCPLGGTATRSCDGLTITILLSSCTVAAPNGTLSFDGTIELTGAFGTCNPAFPFPPYQAALSIQGTFQSGPDTTLNISAELTGTVNTTINLGEDCRIQGASMSLTGSMEAQIPEGNGVQVEFDNTSIALTIDEFDPTCLPVLYSLVFNGGATFTETPGGDSFGAAFVNFTVDQDARGDKILTDLSGQVAADCFGGQVTFDTITALESVFGEFCPTAGELFAFSGGGQARVFYLSDGSVDIDFDGDGTVDETFGSCLDPALLVCEL